jgi:hypothetical protein
VTGDPTSFLKKVHDGANAYRNMYVNSIGEAVNDGEQGLPYPTGTILVKESFNSLAALEARRSPDMTLMVKLAAGKSPETGDWEYVIDGDGRRRGMGNSGIGVFCRDCHLFGAAYDYTVINSKFFESSL